MEAIKEVGNLMNLKNPRLDVVPPKTHGIFLYLQYFHKSCLYNLMLGCFAPGES